MARYLAPAALIAVAAFIAFAAASPLSGDPDDEPARARASVRPGEFPALLPPREVAPTRIKGPLSLFPALSAQRGLALPPRRALMAARRFARSREGEVSFAVLGPGGRISGVAPATTYPSASLVKAMILVAYLRVLAAEQRQPSDSELQLMDDMIRVSDNFSASELYELLGPAPVDDLAAEAGMKSFEANAFWGECAVTAADQVRFFLALDRLLPAEHRELARRLLEHVASFHSWGIPEAARPDWRVFFKGGWRPDDDDGQLVHQAGLLERGARKLAIAVLTSQNPSETYGHDTVRGIARRLLRSGVQPGVLAPLRALEGVEPAAPKRLRHPA